MRIYVSVNQIIDNSKLPHVHIGVVVRLLARLTCVELSCSIVVPTTALDADSSQQQMTTVVQFPTHRSVQMTPVDIKNIREIAERDDVLELLAKSLAPSIYGHDHIKKALVLQLLVSRLLPSSTCCAVVDLQ